VKGPPLKKRPHIIAPPEIRFDEVSSIESSEDYDATWKNVLLQTLIKRKHLVVITRTVPDAQHNMLPSFFCYYACWQHTLPSFFIGVGVVFWGEKKMDSLITKTLLFNQK